jgi:hypothetical protein
VVCRNVLLTAERSRKRDGLLAATEQDLARLQARVQIGKAPGAVLGRRKVPKHFIIADLTTLTGNTVRFGAERTETLFAVPSELQRWGFDLLGLSLTA